MEILEKVQEDNVLRVVVDSNEESLFSMLKIYLQENSDVDVVGLYREHYLVDKTEFFLKVKKGDPLTLFKKVLKEVKKDLESKKLK